MKIDKRNRETEKDSDRESVRKFESVREGRERLVIYRLKQGTLTKVEG